MLLFDIRVLFCHFAHSLHGYKAKPVHRCKDAYSRQRTHGPLELKRVRCHKESEQHIDYFGTDSLAMVCSVRIQFTDPYYLCCDRLFMATDTWLKQSFVCQGLKALCQFTTQSSNAVTLYEDPNPDQETASTLKPFLVVRVFYRVLSYILQQEKVSAAQQTSLVHSRSTADFPRFYSSDL